MYGGDDRSAQRGQRGRIGNTMGGGQSDTDPQDATGKYRSGRDPPSGGPGVTPGPFSLPSRVGEAKRWSEHRGGEIGWRVHGR